MNAKQDRQTAAYLSEIDICNVCCRPFPRGRLIRVEECWDGPYYMACPDCAPVWISERSRDEARRFIPISAEGA